MTTCHMKVLHIWNYIVLLLTLDIFYTFSVTIVDFEQVNDSSNMAVLIR